MKLVPSKDHCSMLQRLLVLLVLCTHTQQLAAEQFGDFTYSSSGTEVTITSYTGSGGNVTIPGTIEGLPVTSIGEYAFESGTGLTGVTIPFSVTSIGVGAFRFCTGLTSVDIPSSVTSIADSAFYGCSSLTSVSISSSVTSIGEYAFAYTGLTDIIIPSSVTVISKGAFDWCGSLSSVTIPHGVTHIGEWAFAESAITSITIPASVTSIDGGAFDGCDLLDTALFLGNAPLSMGNSTEYQNSVFSNTASNFKVQYYNDVTGFTSPTWTTPSGEILPAYNLGDRNAPYVTLDPASNITETSATLSGTVNPLGHVTTAQFEYGLTTDFGSQANVTLAPNDGTTPQAVSAEISGLQLASLYYYRLTATNEYGTNTGGNVMTFTTVNPFSYTISNNEVTITGYTGPGGNLTIPATIEGLPVTRIGDYALSDIRSLTSVTIPSSVTSIGEFAFGICTGLTSVTIPSSVTNIGGGAFTHCTNLTSVTIPPSVTNIGAGAFDFCESLACVTIPSSVTSIGVAMFKNCISLTSITIPSSVTSIGSYAFDTCTGLVDVSIPSGVTSIGYCAFSACTSLTDVTIPSSVSSIGNGAFSFCRNLTSITIPSSVTSIDNWAFQMCDSLETALFYGNAPTMGTGVFEEVSPGFTVQYYNGATGFTSPTWTTSSGDNYPAVNLGDPPTSESRLSTLSVSSCILSPAFDSGTTAYTSSVTEAVESVQVTPGAMDSGATITVNGATVASGNASAPIPLAVGGNILTVVVTAGDGTTQSTYTVTVTRAASWVFTDGFEASSLDPFWTKTVSNGIIDIQSSSPVHSGVQAARFASSGSGQKEAHLSHLFTQPQYGKVSVWFYDNKNYIYFNIRAINTNLSQTASLGVQDWDYQTYYCTAGKTTFPRSIGWHQFTIEFTADALTHSIDGQVVNIGAGGIRYDKVMLSLSGPGSGSVSYDDFRFETYRESDKATASVSLGNLTAQYDGSSKEVTATTNPSGLAVNITYNGSATPPSAVGSYTVNALVNDPHYDGEATGTLVIESALNTFRADNGLALDGSQDEDTPAGDGVTNLEKFAFNMIGSGPGQAASLDIPNRSSVGTTGTAGLPFAETQVDNQTRLQWTYIRRKASTSPGITYRVDFCDDLTTGSWATNPSATESATSIDENFERVTVTDSVVNAARRFSRVRVTAP